MLAAAIFDHDQVSGWGATLPGILEVVGYAAPWRHLGIKSRSFDPKFRAGAVRIVEKTGKPSYCSRSSNCAHQVLKIQQNCSRGMAQADGRGGAGVDAGRQGLCDQRRRQHDRPAVAERFATEGAVIVGVDEVQHSVGEHVVRADLVDEAEVQSMYDCVVRRYGRLDVIYNNMGLMDRGDHSALDTDLTTWRRLHDRT